MLKWSWQQWHPQRGPLLRVGAILQWQCFSNGRSVYLRASTVYRSIAGMFAHFAVTYQQTRPTARTAHASLVKLHSEVLPRATLAPIVEKTSLEHTTHSSEVLLMDVSRDGAVVFAAYVPKFEVSSRSSRSHEWMWIALPHFLIPFR